MYSAPSPRISYRHADQQPGQYLSAPRSTPSPLNRDGRRSPNKADQILGREHGMYADGDNVPLQTMPAQKKKFDEYGYVSGEDDDDYEYDDSSDEVAAERRIRTQTKTLPATKNWNDLPEGFLDAPRRKSQGRSGSGSGSRERNERKDD